MVPCFLRSRDSTWKPILRGYMGSVEGVGERERHNTLTLAPALFPVMKTTWIKTCSSPFLLNWSRRALSTKIEEHTSCIYRLARHRGEECLSFTVDERGGIPITRAIHALNLIIQVCCRRAPGGKCKLWPTSRRPWRPLGQETDTGLNVQRFNPHPRGSCYRAPLPSGSPACDHW